MPRVEADLVLPQDKRSIPHIQVTFPFNPAWVEAIKSVPGVEFKSGAKTTHGGPAWFVPADIMTARLLRKKFGDTLTLTPRLKAWGHEKVGKARTLSALALADTATLARLPARLRPLYDALYVGPRGATMSNKEFRAALAAPEGSFQLADVAFMAKALSAQGVNCVNANQPGMGKTLETIGAVFESPLADGPHLVIAPVTSLDVVWQYELEKWQDQPVIIASDHKVQRTKAIAEARAMERDGEPFWLVCSPAMVQYRNRHIINEAGEEDTEEYILYPEISEVDWATLVLDEFHKMGLGNPATGTARAVNKLKGKGKVGLSGTPLGGNPIKLYGILHWLDPEEFSSKWRFVNQWLEVDEKEYQKRGGGVGTAKTPGGILESRREEFDTMLSQYLTRRTKDECLPWLPPKQFKDIWATMKSKQDKQYRQFAEDAEIRIDEEHLSAASILAEYMRLKQFANATQQILGLDPKTGKPLVSPTDDSCKLPHVMQLLDERGIRKEDPEGDEQVVIFSQFSQMVDMVTNYLNSHGIPAEKITGEVTGKKRGEMIRRFQAGLVRVAVITTTAGGVSITLDKANTAIVLDETWNPDDQEQAVDRIHRGAKTAQVLVYTIRTKGTVEEYIQEVNLDKTAINYQILDLRRKGLRATGVVTSKRKAVK